MKRLELRNDKIVLDVLPPPRIAVNENNVLINKIEELRHLLSSTVVDEERTVFGVEPIYKAILGAEERQLVKDKLIELITKL